MTQGGFEQSEKLPANIDSGSPQTVVDQHKAHVLFAVERTGWAAVMALATLAYYRFELAFPLALP